LLFVDEFDLMERLFKTSGALKRQLPSKKGFRTKFRGVEG